MTARWSGVAAPLAVLAVVVGADIAFGTKIVISAAYSIAAVLAGAMTTVRRTSMVALLAVLLSALSGVWNHNFAALDWWVRLTLSVGLGGLAVVSARIRVQRERALRQMTVIAETAQRAVLRTIPTEVGSVGIAARYVSATRSALVGGDLYEVAETPYGVRVIVGDVRGKGLEAVQMAAAVLAAFRRAAFGQPSLPSIAADLDRVLAAIATDEDFVTAILAEFHDDHTVSLVNCGHHPPLLVTADCATDTVETGEPELPLGLEPKPSPVTVPWPQGSRLLLFTDGLVEARDRRGEFFPLADHAALLCGGELDQALDALLGALTRYTGRRLNDDLAVVLAENTAT